MAQYTVYVRRTITESFGVVLDAPSEEEAAGIIQAAIFAGEDLAADGRQIVRRYFEEGDEEIMDI